MLKDRARTWNSRLGIALIAMMIATTPSLASDRDRKGLIFGVNAGGGGAGFNSQLSDQTLTDDPFGGGAGALRGGYAFSDAFALNLEFFGFGSDGGNEDWGLGAAFVTATWWPDGNGFFLRAGVGGGGGDILRRDTGKLVHFEEKGAALFGLGYEWRVGREFGLGVAFDGIGFDLDGASGGEDDFATLSTFSVQFNWYK